MTLHLDFDEQIMRRYYDRGAPLLFYIHWIHGHIAYPSKDWMDFGVVIVDWWLAAAKRLLEGATEEELPFMDGPYRMFLRREANMLRVLTKDAPGDWTVPTEEFIDELMGAAATIGVELARLGISQDDQKGLQKGTADLKEASRRPL